jgi:hypothetical protein
VIWGRILDYPLSIDMNGPVDRFEPDYLSLLSM